MRCVLVPRLGGCQPLSSENFSVKFPGRTSAQFIVQSLDVRKRSPCSRNAVFTGVSENCVRSIASHALPDLLRSQARLRVKTRRPGGTAGLCFSGSSPNKFAAQNDGQISFGCPPEKRPLAWGAGTLAWLRPVCPESLKTRAENGDRNHDNHQHNPHTRGPLNQPHPARRLH